MDHRTASGNGGRCGLTPSWRKYSIAAARTAITTRGGRFQIRDEPMKVISEVAKAIGVGPI